MTTVAEHRAAVLALATRLPSVTVPVAEALGCVLAEPVRAATQLPPYDSSAMDGYGVRAADVANAPVTLDVVDAAPAGSPATLTELPPGSCIRILTGGLVPPSVDAVVPVEDTDGGRERVRIAKPVPVGQSVRRAGEEMAAGTVVLTAGQRVTPAAIMAAAAAGAATVSVVRRPRVAVVSTGDELVPAGQPMAPGQLPDSNGPGLAAAVRAAGGEVVAIEHARDDVAAVTELLGRLAAIADLVITTGGVSAGAENDPIRAALDGRSGPGFDVRFVAVGMQPGKPQALGRLGSAAYLGFPGNPVSCLVSWAVFGRPLLRRLGGAAEPTPTVAVLGGPVQGLASRQRYVRARLTGGPQPGSAAVATPLDGYGSHLVGGLGATGGFIELPPGDDAYDPGTPVVFLPLEAP